LARRCGAIFLHFHERGRFPRHHWTSVLSAIGLVIRILFFRRSRVAT
jgi:hypothetical protein